MTDLGALSRDPAFLRRIGVTLGALAVYRVGSWITLPGVDISALVGNTAPGDFGTVVTRISILALGITPLLSALIVAEMAMIAWPPLRAWASETANRSRLDSWALLFALAFATLQASGIATALEDIRGLVPHPGLAFRAGAVVSMVAATALLAWLASLITRHGIGSGFWILVAVPHALSFTEALLVQSSLWGPASVITIALSVGFLALSIAVLAALTKTIPPLAKTDELVWVPIVGFAAASLLLTAVLLVLWLAAPSGQDGGTFDALMPAQGAVLLPLITVPLIVVLRRRSFGGPLAGSDIAAAAPLAAALAGLIAIGTLIEYIPAQPLFPGSGTTLILAAVGIAIVDGLTRPISAS